jgi:hypothetical protein
MKPKSVIAIAFFCRWFLVFFYNGFVLQILAQGWCIGTCCCAMLCCRAQDPYRRYGAEHFAKDGAIIWQTPQGLRLLGESGSNLAYE